MPKAIPSTRSRPTSHPADGSAGPTRPGCRCCLTSRWTDGASTGFAPAGSTSSSSSRRASCSAVTWACTANGIDIARADRVAQGPHQASIALEVDGQVYVCFQAEDVEVLSAGGVRRRELESRIGPEPDRRDVALRTIAARAARFWPRTRSWSTCCSTSGSPRDRKRLQVRSAVPRADRPAPPSGATGRGEPSRSCTRPRGRCCGRISAAVPVRPPVNADGAGDLWVYGRLGRPCLRCGAAIRLRAARTQAALHLLLPQLPTGRLTGNRPEGGRSPYPRSACSRGSALAADLQMVPGGRIPPGRHGPPERRGSRIHGHSAQAPGRDRGAERLRPAHHGRGAADLPRGREIRPTSYEPLTPEQTEALVYSVLREDQRKRFEQSKELDLSFGGQGPEPVPHERLSCSGAWWRPPSG